MYAKVVFDLNDFLKALTAYTNGDIPPDAEAINFGPSTMLRNWYAIVARAKDWPNSKKIPGKDAYPPYHFRYEAGQMATWDEKGTPMEYGRIDSRSKN